MNVEFLNYLVMYPSDTSKLWALEDLTTSSLNSSERRILEPLNVSGVHVVQLSSYKMVTRGLHVSDCYSYKKVINRTKLDDKWHA
jgi:hypothetical protein